jgi:hypothetical protein
VTGLEAPRTLFPNIRPVTLLKAVKRSAERVEVADINTGHYNTSRKIAGSIPDEVFGLFN